MHGLYEQVFALVNANREKTRDKEPSTGWFALCLLSFATAKKIAYLYKDPIIFWVSLI